MPRHETNHCTLPPVFDPCCGGRMCYFDKHDSRVLFSDIRCEEHILCDGRVFTVSPDVIADFRKLPYPDAIFSLVLFDPPHLEHCGPRSWQAKKYGKLDKNTWREDARGACLLSATTCFRTHDHNQSQDALDDLF